MKICRISECNTLLPLTVVKSFSIHFKKGLWDHYVKHNIEFIVLFKTQIYMNCLNSVRNFLHITYHTTYIFPLTWMTIIPALTDFSSIEYIEPFRPQKAFGVCKERSAMLAGQVCLFRMRNKDAERKFLILSGPNFLLPSIITISAK